MSQRIVSETLGFACSEWQWWDLIRSETEPLLNALSEEDAGAFDAAKEHVVSETEHLLRSAWSRLRATAPTKGTRFQHFGRNKFQGVTARRHANCWLDLTLIKAKRSWVYVAMETDREGEHSIRLCAFIRSAAENIAGFSKSLPRGAKLGIRVEDRWYLGDVRVKAGATHASLAEELQTQCWPGLKAYSNFITPGHAGKAPK